MDQEEPELCDVLTPKKPESTHFMIKEDDYDKKSLPKRRAKQCFLPWASEASWCLVAFLLLGLLVFALLQFDGKTQPKWPLGLSLNTLIAFLSTICRCVMVHPIAEGLLQLKWNWFAGKGRPLRDIRLFDKASRSSWASLKLVTRLRGRFMPMGVLASLVLVASLGTSFITQSTISYSTRTVVAHNKSALSIKAETNQIFQVDYAEDGLLRAAERSLIYRIDEDEGLSALEPHCPTANCRWPIFSSLAVCVSMGNVTEYLTEVDSEITLPRGFGQLRGGFSISSPAYFAGQEEPDNSNATEPLYKWNNSDTMTLSLARAFFLYAIPYYEDDKDADAWHAEAVEVVWHYCVHTYNVSVTDNVANTELLASELTVSQRDERNGSFTLLAKNGHREFNISLSSMLHAFRRRLPTTIIGVWLPFATPEDQNYNEFTYQIGQNVFSGCLWSNPNRSAELCRRLMWNDARNVTETMALAMTNYMRANQVNGAVQGEALESEIFITVRWAWISFLAAQIGLTIAFIWAVAACTSNLEVPVIKGSNAAELFAIRKSDMETTTIGTVNGKQAGIDQKIDKKTLGILVRDYDTWHLEIHSKE
ncbi:hypothetical protein MAJ_05150, partial [Metarhizium majus ARSEF 297]